LAVYVLQLTKTVVPSNIFFLGSLCFATDEDGCAVENFCNTLFKCTYIIGIGIFGIYLELITL
jgi:hypothetical protein